MTLRLSEGFAFPNIPCHICGGYYDFSVQVAAQEASDCRAKLARDTLELGKIVSVKTGQVSRRVIKHPTKHSTRVHPTL